MKNVVDESETTATAPNHGVDDPNARKTCREVEKRQNWTFKLKDSAEFELNREEIITCYTRPHHAESLMWAVAHIWQQVELKTNRSSGF